VYIYTCVYVSIDAHLSMRPESRSSNAHISARDSVYTHENMYMYICIYIYIYIIGVDVRTREALLADYADDLARSDSDLASDVGHGDEGSDVEVVCETRNRTKCVLQLAYIGGQ
jgi:hypothetical protein